MNSRISSRNPEPLNALIHIVSWLLILGFPLLMMERSSSTDFNWLSYFRHLSASLAFGIVFYSNYSLLFPRLFLKNRRREYLFYNVFLIVVVTLLLHFSAEWFRSFSRPFPVMSLPHPHFLGILPPPRWAFFLRDLVMMGVMVGLAAAICMSCEWRKAESARCEAENARAESELKMLRNQLSPHFLLNTLNNIYALINFDAEKAQRAVMELSKLLRHMLYENQRKYVPLQHETDFIRSYVELMRLRLNKEVSVNMDIRIHPERNTQIAPLIFISLIENAFKHGVSPTNSSFISVSIQEDEGGDVTCAIRNSNYPKSEIDKSGSGIGLEQVRRRLELLYSGAYSWEYGVEDDGKVYTSVLTIYNNRKL